ncbi:PQQ-dependent sugar dehydrogenase [Arthrobacter tecti]
MRRRRRSPFRSGRRATGLAAAALAFAISGCDAGAEPAPEFRGSAPASQSTAPASTPSTASSEPATPSASPTIPNLSVVGEVVTGLGVPWSMAVLPDDSVIVTERETAEVKRIADGQVTVLGVIGDAIEAGGEGGLLGVAIGPDFETDPRLYLYYTSPSDNRIISVPYTSDRLGEPEIILTGIPKANVHNGGRIKFGPDGFLYAGTGDATDAASAQDPASLGGKILRITADGEPAPDNPFGNAVYTLGHRNVQGLAWDSEERLWASEFGPDQDDELNLITSGSNYGWPEVTGAPGREEYVDAQVVWPSPATSSPSGIAIVDDVAYIGGLRGERLWQVPLFSGVAGEPVSHFEDQFGRLRDTTIGPDGELLIATNEGGGSRIVRVEMQ